MGWVDVRQQVKGRKGMVSHLLGFKSSRGRLWSARGGSGSSGRAGSRFGGDFVVWPVVECVSVETGLPGVRGAAFFFSSG